MRQPVYTPEFVERGYNNRAAVPDHPAWFETFARRSDEAVKRHRPALDLRFGPGPKETLDLFVPAGGARGTLLFIHGGYWRALDKADHRFVAGPFVEAGYAVAVQNYDLCPAVSIATIVDECRRAVAWLVREGEQYGAPTTRLVVSGHSAGGHLAAMMLATPPGGFGLARHPVTAAVSVSGVHDLRPLTLFSFNSDFKLDDAEAARLSPVCLAAQIDAPLLVAVGADETGEFLRQAELMVQAWPANRPDGRGAAMIIPDRHHFSVIVDYAEPASALTRETLALFDVC